MSNDSKRLKKLSLALGATFAASVAMSNVASAASTSSNPFAVSDLNSGYMQLAGNKCGEGKCGGEKKSKKEGKCGEGKCGGEKKSKKEGKCGEGKCGEGKCGGDKKKDKKEGKCGEGKCGGS